MAYEPHYQVTWGGTIAGTAEMWQCGLALMQKDYTSGILPLDPNGTVWDDVRDDIQAFHAASSFIGAAAVLKWVKAASIGTDGKYAAAPALRDVAGGVGVGGGGAAGFGFPPQVAWAVTLNTDTLLNKVKGRFYLPCPRPTLAADGRVSAFNAEELRDQVDTLITNINNQPGWDVLDIAACVASGARQDAYAATNHEVTSVTVGRTLDTIRRRRNKVPEAYVAAAPVS